MEVMKYCNFTSAILVHGVVGFVLGSERWREAALRMLSRWMKEDSFPRCRVPLPEKRTVKCNKQQQLVCDAAHDAHWEGRWR